MVYLKLTSTSYSAISGDMKLFASLLLAAAAVTVFAAAEYSPSAETGAGERAVDPPAGVMPSGPLLGPLTPEDVNYDRVAVPEPVWASVLAACAVSLLRRGRH